jgi:hypothetical protein
VRADLAEILEEERLKAGELELHLHRGGADVPDVDHQRELLGGSGDRAVRSAKVLGLVVSRCVVIVLNGGGRKLAGQ